jgi:hypothetical protein
VFPVGGYNLAIAQAQPQPAAKGRTYRRFELVSPVLFRCANPAGPNEIGYCTNLGLGGIFIVTTHCPAPGTSVYVEVLIRAPHSAGSLLRLKCTGKVVRTQNGDQLSGFAVAGPFENQIIRKYI